MLCCTFPFVLSVFQIHGFSEAGSTSVIKFILNILNTTYKVQHIIYVTNRELSQTFGGS
jgi:hypothetical protein